MQKEECEMVLLIRVSKISSSLSSSSMSTPKLYIPFFSFNFFVKLLLIISLACHAEVAGQDFYGASYANNRSPDEIRQRARNTPELDDPSHEPLDGTGIEVTESRQGCQGPWQWQCDSGHCIAQYDLCDGVTQCPDESDEKNCRGRFGPSQHINNYRQQPEAIPKPTNPFSTTHSPSTTPSPSSSNNGSILLPLKLVFAGAAAFILVAGLAHVFVKRRQLQATVRNYRKGQSLVDDEDDLLISQMYS